MAPTPSAAASDPRKSATCEHPASAQAGSDGVSLDQFVTGVTRLRALLASMVPHLPDSADCDLARDLLAEALPLAGVLVQVLDPIEAEPDQGRRAPIRT